MQEIYEKLGLFYLGRDVDGDTMAPTEVLTLLKSKHFTTHAAIIGMTGSGKTGLGIGLIEEAAVDNIPAIIIDPKGDMGNLCLTDPYFSPSSFEPWVKDEASYKAEESFAYAKQKAQAWKEGLERSGQSADRVRKYHQVKKTIYTPGSSSGVMINILSSLEVPPEEILQESDTFASYLKSTSNSLLALIGLEVDAVDSKEYILLAQILMHAWMHREDLSIEKIIGKILQPEFEKIGVLRVDDFYPPNDRFKFAMKFNALLANPSFSTWLQGENLDIQNLLYDEEGNAKVAIFSIAHLNDDERMFFVTLLLNTYIAWMRRQSGTSALKTLLYMDEIFGFFPPTKNPPSKTPMMLLLKQARAFGVGIVLSTQNPVDLDYKGLSNIGTWFVGRLQTTQDIERVIDGLGGKIGSAFSKSEIKTLLANIQQRTFFLKSAHLEGIRLFSTRWVMSYLKGPLNKQEISDLMKKEKQRSQDSGSQEQMLTYAEENVEAFPQVDRSIPQYFQPDIRESYYYQPSLSAKVRVTFFQQRRGIDESREWILTLPLAQEDQYVLWDDAREIVDDFTHYPHFAPEGAKYYPVPEIVQRDKGLKQAVRLLKEMVYKSEVLEIFRCELLKMESKVGESHGAFTVRVQDMLQDKKEEELEQLQERYGKKEKILLERITRANGRVEKEAADTRGSIIEAGIAVIGALFGRKSPSSIGRAVGKGSKILKERGEKSRAEKRVMVLEEELILLQETLQEEMIERSEKYVLEHYPIHTVKIKPRKGDIHVESCALVWRI